MNMNLSRPQLPEPPRIFEAGGDILLFEETALAKKYPVEARPAAWYSSDGQAQSGYRRDGQVAVVSITGPLDQRGGWWWDGYDSITRRVANALGDPQVGAVLLVIDSPGGVVAGCWEAVHALRLASKSTGKPLLVYTDEMACSAAYALSCAAEAIVVPTSGVVGSIGVIATQMSYAEALEKEGIRIAVLSSGKRKADGHPALPLSKEALDRMQARIDEYAKQFFALVAEVRPLSSANIKALEADIFVGDAAVAAKLADKVGTFADALALARSRAKSTVAVKATAPQETPKMKTVLTALGLSAEATEAEALAALTKLTSTTSDLRGVTRQATDAEAIGVVKGWSAKASAYDTLLAERETEKAAARSTAIDAIFQMALDTGRLTAGEIEAKKKSITAGVLSLDTDEKVAAYRAEVEAGPVRLPSQQNKKPEGGNAIGGKGWAEMSFTERAQMRRSNPEAARALSEAYEAEQKAEKAKPKAPKG